MADETVADRPGCDLREHRVRVGNKPYVVCVSKTSEDGWTAVAEYDGQWLEATGTSEVAAVASWQQRAERTKGVPSG